MKKFSHAKLNLALNVIGKQPNGYHSLDMIMVPIELHDTMIVRLCSEPGIHLTCNDETVPLDDSNTIVKTYQLVRQQFPSILGVLIDLDKRIPMQAGLGGGSSNAATTLLALNELYELNLSLDQLINLGRQIGADVPFFLVQSSAHVQGIGEIVDPIPNPLKGVHVLLVKPTEGLSTKEVFGHVEPPYIIKKEEINQLINHIKEGDIQKLSSQMFNDLESPAFKVNPKMEAMKKDLMETTHLPVLMTGSGSTFFIICQNEKCLKKFQKKLSIKYNYVHLTRFF